MAFDTEIAVAAQLHQDGRLDEAEGIYRQILRHDSDHADALHLLGLIERRRGDPARAITLLRQAVAANPRFAAAYYNLGNALTNAGERQEALACYDKALALHPHPPPFRRFVFDLDGVRAVFADAPGSRAAIAIIGELYEDVYRFGAIDFRPGDVVIDIGGHVGIVSIFLARKFPFLTIHTYEPSPVNHANLVDNLRANGVGNVVAHHQAVTADGRPLELYLDPVNSGGTSGFRGKQDNGAAYVTVPSTTLDRIFADHGIDRCRLLKIDCEGAEHEILRTTGVLPRIDHMRAEFHLTALLAAQGHSVGGLMRHLRQTAPQCEVHVATVVASQDVPLR